MQTQEITYREAIVAALQEEMRRDPKTLVMGEDIGPSGGPFKTCQGLFEEFGHARVRDTPIAETGFVGAALGLAITGYRPIVEIMFADFLGVCFDQIVNGIAKHRFMSGGQFAVPVTIRAIGGAGLRFGPQHSTTAESWFMSVPGLKIVCPSSPAEAYGMLKSAIRDDDPVLVLEHKALLSSKGQVPVGSENGKSLSGPRILRPGRDVTVVASLAMVHRALGAAEKLAAEGIEAEVIDIRAPAPDGPDQCLRERAEDQQSRDRRGAGPGRRLGRGGRGPGDERGLRPSGFPAAAGDPARSPRALQPAAGGQRIALPGFHRGGGQVAAVMTSDPSRHVFPLPRFEAGSGGDPSRSDGG